MGRPKNPSKTVKLSVSLDKKTIAFLRSKGGGNASLAIRQIVETEQKKQEATSLSK